MGKYQLEVGQRFGRGIITEGDIRVPRPGRKSGTPGARLRCDCGTVYESAASVLMDGHRQSCGCLKSDMSRANGRLQEGTHGLTRHELYGTWVAMLHRCEDPDWSSYPYYGGRGIQVCNRWHDVTAFVTDIEADIGPRPDGYTLDRIRNSGNYEPGNVRWASRSEQSRNRRPFERKRGPDGRFAHC
jgi:hypothetical protein